MDIVVNLDEDQLGELEQKMGSLEQALKAVIPLVAERTYFRIMELAATELNTTYPAYIAALDIDTKTNEVVLDASKPGAEVAWMVEHGTEGYDMRASLRGASYRVVPFKHSPPGSKSQSAPQMGSGYAKAGWWGRYAKQIGKETYAAAKNLPPGRKLSGLNHPTAKVYHKFPLYEGMVRKTSGPKGGRAQYLTFRTMTADSPGWQYPAKEGREFFRRASEDVDRFVAEAIEELLG